MSDFRPPFTQSPLIRVMFNLGATLDLHCGTWITGRLGESIMNGGMGTVVGVTAIANAFKSTFLHYMSLTAYAQVTYQYQDKTSMSTYDTEDNKHEHHLHDLTQRNPIFKGRNILEENRWIVTSKAMHSGTEWFSILKSFLEEKGKRKDLMVKTPFFGRDGKSALQIIVPTFGDIDSLTEFSSDAENKMLDENDLGESGANTYFMKSGAVKTRLMMELPTLATKYSHYTGMTAQLGKEIVIAQGPATAMPTKKLGLLKNGDKMKSVTDKFTYATTVCYHIYNAAPMINQSTKLAEYPNGPDDNSPTDLYMLNLRVLRSKSGPSGVTLEIVISQTEGVLAELTDFHYIKTMDRYGITGTLQHYALDLYPECKLQRTTVRSKIDDDAKLRRALLITSEMCQMKYLAPVREDLMCTPKELYDDLIKLGYDWDILFNTRAYWLIDNYKSEIPFLSTMDLLRMRKGEYHPFWLNADKKTIKDIKEYYPD